MRNKRKHKKALSSGLPPIKERNSVALNPLLKKSAVHEKSKKAKRQAAKVQLKKTWFERVTAFAVTGQSYVLLPAL